MHKRYQILAILIFALSFTSLSQEHDKISIRFVKNQASVLPGKVLNLAFQITNAGTKSVSVLPEVTVPESWAMITRPNAIDLQPGNTHLALVSVKSGFGDPVKNYVVQLKLFEPATRNLLDSTDITIKVLEMEDVSLQLLERPSHVLAGDNITATYVVQNKGNTKKDVFLSASNCDVIGNPSVTLYPGETQQIHITKSTSASGFESRNESYTMRVQTGDSILESVYTSTLVLPSQKAKRDLYFRFPVKASATYLSTNRNNQFESAYQYQIEGNGTLDPEGKHQLSFFARWPNNTDLSFLGLYDQYYVFYANKNLDVFVGEKSFVVTPLTENARYGRGVETKVTLNNGFNVGFTYLKPRFYEGIENEMSFSTGFNFNQNNKISLFYLSKKYTSSPDPAQLLSATAGFNPFERTNVDLEFSKAYFLGEASTAYRAGLNSQFSVFQVSGIYYEAGKNYPGYYTNSKFYSGNINARLTEKLSLSVNGREDFSNAQLDTFFVIAPYSRMFQGSVNYRMTSESSVRLYYRQYERKDRLSLNKFHYQTNSWNLMWSQRYRRFYSILTGEIGETTNYLLADNNQQNSYRAAADFSYRFNSKHSLRVFGTWSNINQFVSTDQRKLTAGIAATSLLTKNLRLNFYMQNAYDIEDYYRNRNLLQFNLDYSFMKYHSVALRSFYTIFKTEADPELTMALTYSYNLGIPLKQIVAGGTIKGKIVDQQGNGKEGIYVRVSSETTVSDKNGEYEFKLVPPGRQMLLLDNDKLELNEVTNTPMPLEVDVIENETNEINIQIVRGSRLNGKIELEKTSLSALNNQDAALENIVLELLSNFDKYRVTTDRNGLFMFPLFRPGTVMLKIYSNTIPAGYALPQSNYSWTISSDEEKEVVITLESKKKNIIFKPSGNILSTGNLLKTSENNSSSETEKSESQVFYSVQIGAFKTALPASATILKNEPFYFEKQIDNLHKYFIGKFNTQKEAEYELKRLKEKHRQAFIVVLDGDRILRLEEFNRNK